MRRDSKGRFLPRGRTRSRSSGRQTVRVREDIVVRAARPAKRHHRSGGGSSLSIGSIIGGAATHAEVIAPGTGGFIVGKLQDAGLLDKLPSIPVVGDFLGKKGEALAIMHVLKPHSTGLYRDTKIALAAICGFELATTGEIKGY